MSQPSEEKTLQNKRMKWAMAVLVTGLVLAACGGDDGTDTAAGGSASGDAAGEGGELSGTIVVDGSSTVTPLITIAAEDFQGEHSGVRVPVGTSGTGGGFEKFCVGETDISMASRPIKDEEAATCESNGVEPVEFIVANDALSVIVHPENDWADCLTVEQLQTMWSPESDGSVTSWDQVDPSFPDQRMTLFGAGSDSGTFDYFTEEINGDTGAIRTDYNPSEDDNVTITGVQGDEGAVGFLGLSYVLENEGRIKAVEIDGGDGCVAPSAETVIDGSYVPLGRPLFVYFKAESLQRPEVAAFAEYYAENQEQITTDALFIPLSEEQQAEQREALDAIAG
jgi:phosphate binding protein